MDESSLVGELLFYVSRYVDYFVAFAGADVDGDECVDASYVFILGASALYIAYEYTWLSVS